MMRSLLTILCLMTFIGCGNERKPLDGFPNAIQTSVDTFQTEGSRWVPWERPTDCFAQIEKAMCVVDSRLEGENSNWAARPCIKEDVSDITKRMETIYKHLNPVHQKMFCSIRKIYLEKEFFATAYAGSIMDPEGELDGVVLGFRKSFLDQGVDLSDWNSWKEQLNFGGDPKFYKNKKDLPQYTYTTPDDVDHFLYIVVTHEFGHFFDSANQVNQVDYHSNSCTTSRSRNTPRKTRDCPITQNTWTSISWDKSNTPKRKFEFPQRSHLCFYGCDGRGIKSDYILDLYQGLVDSPFISTYGASNIADDFAEVVAYHSFIKDLGGSAKLDTKRGLVVDFNQHLESDHMKEKVEYLEKLLSNPEIKYP